VLRAPVPEGIFTLSIEADDVAAAAEHAAFADRCRHQYPGAAVEQFETARGVGVGIRRCEETVFAAAASAGQPPTVITGTSQALVPFPEAGLLGTVTGFCPASAGIDIATVFNAAIAHHMTAIAQAAPALSP
jgi:hypothetical protein